MSKKLSPGVYQQEEYKKKKKKEEKKNDIARFDLD